MLIHYFDYNEVIVNLKRNLTLMNYFLKAYILIILLYSNQRMGDAYFFPVMASFSNV